MGVGSATRRNIALDCPVEHVIIEEISSTVAAVQRPKKKVTKGGPIEFEPGNVEYSSSSESGGSESESGGESGSNDLPRAATAVANSAQGSGSAYDDEDSDEDNAESDDEEDMYSPPPPPPPPPPHHLRLH